jgi:hypothetical protein
LYSTKESHLIQVWVPDVVGIPLREAAKRAERSLSAEIRFALKQYLENSEAARPDQGGGSATRRHARDDYSVSG